jgi:hypothetical protein
MTTFNTNLGGKIGSVAYELGDNSVSTRSQSGERKIELRDVAEVRLNELGGIGICELKSKDGTSFNVSSGKPENARGYIEFLEDLHSKLATLNPRPRFLAGSWLLVGTYVAIAFLVMVFAALLYFDVVDLPIQFAGRKVVFIGLGVVALVVGPFVYPRYRPKQYDPSKLPPRYLPSPKC